MKHSGRIAGLLRKKILILDGAMGTELQKRGLPAGVCPEAWCLANPAAVAEIHASYREAGADIVYTATFGANRIKMGGYGLDERPRDEPGTGRDCQRCRRGEGSRGGGYRSHRPFRRAIRRSPL